MATSTFRAAVVRIPNGPDSIEIIDVPVVDPGPGEIRVAVAAAQAVDLLGDAPAGAAARLLVTGAAGAVGANVTVLAQDRGWQVTGLARTGDEEFVRSLGADFTAHAEPEWDAVVDCAQLNEQALTLLRDGGTYVGLRPGLAPAEERGISVAGVVTAFDGARLADLLSRTASGELAARVHAVVTLDQAADARRATALSGLRGRYIICP
ncbi:zinc-binding dehydrogenase [Streptomyces sp. NPDC052415]|uniref:zinc-binding dehydrogenase n=1 Tax=Streptomyces sp. NPDC052415 TaxID=3365690 RepID=UPI0037D3B093